MVRGETPGVGCVDRDRKSAIEEEVAGGFEYRGGASGAVTIAKHEISSIEPAGRARGRWHRVTID